MQIRKVRRGMFEAVGKTVVLLTPEGSNPEDEHGQLAVSFNEGGSILTVRSNCPSDDATHFIGLDAIRHLNEATSEVLRLMAKRSLSTATN